MDAARAQGWANPASVHAAGRASRALLERAREQVAGAIGARAADLVLTSGGTEACNLGLQGLSPVRVITTTIEHPAVAACCARLAGRGAQLIQLPVAGGAAPGPQALAGALGAGGGDAGDTLVAVAWVNHETGTVLPVEGYAQVCRAAGAMLFVDATQAAGKLPLAVEQLGADMLAVASHKLGGPAGAGALWVRRGVELEPVALGGGQERGRRPGTPDVLAAVGFGAACEQLPSRLAEQPRLQRLRDRLEAALVADGWVSNGAGHPRVATVANLSLRGTRGDMLVAALDLEGLCVASGAACSSGLQQPSPVLRAMYPDEAWRAESALRISFGPQTSESDCIFAIEAIEKVAARVNPERV